MTLIVIYYNIIACQFYLNVKKYPPKIIYLTDIFMTQILQVPVIWPGTCFIIEIFLLELVFIVFSFVFPCLVLINGGNPQAHLNNPDFFFHLLIAKKILTRCFGIFRIGWISSLPLPLWKTIKRLEYALCILPSFLYIINKTSV